MIDNTYEFYKSSLIPETESLTPFDIQENDILKWEIQRTLNGSEIFILKW